MRKKGIVVTAVCPGPVDTEFFKFSGKPQNILKELTMAKADRVAMGITGSEVSKDAAAMVLTDDNFATIIKAVENGRNIYRNIKASIQFLLSGNFGAILAVLYGVRSYSFGLHSVQFLPEVCMIISPVCFLNEMTEHRFLRYVESILEMS